MLQVVKSIVDSDLLLLLVAHHAAVDNDGLLATYNLIVPFVIGTDLGSVEYHYPLYADARAD